MTQYQCGACGRTFNSHSGHCPHCGIKFGEEKYGQAPKVRTREEMENDRRVFAVIAFFVPAALYLFCLYRLDLLNAWPVTLGVTLFLAVGLFIAEHVARDPYKSEPTGEGVWNAAAMLAILLPPELCVLALNSLDLDSVWAVVGGIVGGLTLGGLAGYLLIGEKDKPGLLRRTASARTKAAERDVSDPSDLPGFDDFPWELQQEIRQNWSAIKSGQAEAIGRRKVAKERSRAFWTLVAVTGLAGAVFAAVVASGPEPEPTSVRLVRGVVRGSGSIFLGAIAAAVLSGLIFPILAAQNPPYSEFNREKREWELRMGITVFVGGGIFLVAVVAGLAGWLQW